MTSVFEVVRRRALPARPRPVGDALTSSNDGSVPRIDTVLRMLVADLQHFMDLPDDTPGPARRLAGQLSGIVRAATPATPAWRGGVRCPVDGDRGIAPARAG